MPLASLGERAGDEVDAELARDLARPADRAPFQRLGAAQKSSCAPSMLNFSGNTTSSAPSAAAARRGPVRGARFGPCPSVELS